jgi:hypothetical protein
VGCDTASGTVQETCGDGGRGNDGPNANSNAISKFISRIPECFIIEGCRGQTAGTQTTVGGRCWTAGDSMVLRKARLEEIATQLEGLAAALRLLIIDGAEEVPTAQQPPPSPPAQPMDDRVRVGSRVRVVRGTLDRYRGRTGIVLSRRGDLFWNLRMDTRGRETEGPLIYKKETSLQVVPRV